MMRRNYDKWQDGVNDENQVKLEVFKIDLRANA